MNVDTLDWASIIADAAGRLDWVKTQSADPAEQARLLDMAGDGPAVDMIPAPVEVRKARRKAITRARMARLLGQRKAGRWAGREQGKPVGTFNPADITPEQAASLLVVVGDYVRRWAGPFNRHPLGPEGQEDAVARIVHSIWTRDYAKAGLGAGNLAGATWQTCALYRKTGWVGPEVLDKTNAKREKRRGDLGEWTPARACDNPARLFWAVENAADGLSAPAVVNRGRKQSRRSRGRKRMDAIDRATARECLTGTGAE